MAGSFRLGIFMGSTKVENSNRETGERGISSLQPPGRRSGRRWPQLGGPPASTTSSKPKKDATSSKASASPKKTNARPFGIQKVTPVSSALAHFLNSYSASRVDAVKKIWSYIKLHNLQNPTNKRKIYCDAKLKSIFDGKEKVGFLEIGKLLTTPLQD